MTTARRFTRTVFGRVWTFEIDTATGVVSVERDGFEALGHRYPGFRHENHASAERGAVAMMREAVVMLNRLRSAASVTYLRADATRLAGRSGFANVNSCRWNRRADAQWRVVA